MTNNLRLLVLLTIGMISTVQGQPGSDTYRFSEHIKTAVETDTTEWRYQSGAVNFSFIGDYKSSLDAWDKAMPKAESIPTASDSLILKSARIENARNYIIERSKDENIIIVNEAHHNPKHRIFTKSLLEGLYKNGYRYLGLEAISDTTVNERNYAVKNSGFYTAEPEFGNLIYEAKKLGFVIFGYEASFGKNGKEREIEQARNIQKFMKLNRDGKYVIHCGFNHVYENEVRNWEKAMAGRLKEFSEIDPLTIDQVKLSEHSKADRNHYFLTATKEKEPFILKSPDNTIFNGLEEPKQTDILVIHPITEYKYERPVWTSSGRKEYWVSGERLRKYPYPIQILAFRFQEYENGGIPTDIIELSNKQNNKPLYLRKGKYTVVVRNTSYEVIDKFTFSME